MRLRVRALAESLIAQASAFRAEGKPTPVAVRLAAEEWTVLKGFLAPLLEAGDLSLFAMRVELVEAVGDEHRFAFVSSEEGTD